jgi:hypothetical protein
MALESELRALAADVAWPPTPALDVDLAPRRRGLRRPTLTAAAVALAALAAALAVPQSRGAILRFLHLGGVEVAFVERLPAAQERPLAETLGPRIARAEARTLLGGELLLPPLSPPPPLHAQQQVVSFLLRDRGEPVLLSELSTGSAAVLQKLAPPGTSVTRVRVGGDPGIWLAGERHLVLFPGAPPRLAGHVLVWQHGTTTLRLEGAGLTLARALELARTFR